MVQILDQYGRPIQRKQLEDEQSARLGWVRHEFADHPTRGLNPVRLQRILEDAEQGNLVDQSDLFTDMEERDAHLFAEMSKRKRAILTLDWTVTPPRNASADEKRQAELVKDWLTDLPDFEDVLLDCLDAIGHGFAALEVAWQRTGSEWLPARLTHRPQRWFQTLPHDGNALRLRDGTAEGAELWPMGWVVHRHRAKSGYLTRAGLHRVLAWPYLFKWYAVRDFAEFLEIYGLPMRVGKYGPGATPDERDTLLQAVSELGHNAAGIIPEEMQIELKEAARGTHDPFASQRDWCERSVSKAVLGGTLTTQADGKTSTNALGQVHNEVRHDLLVSDARQLAGTMTRDLVWPLLALNDQAPDPRRMPRLVFDIKEAEDISLYADSLPKLVGLGMTVPVSWVRDKLSIPAPQGDEPVLSAPRPDMALPPELRPVTKPVQTAAASLQYRAVLQNRQGELVYPDQDALDQAALPADAINIAQDAMLAPVSEAIRNGATPDDAMEALATLYPTMPAEQLTELLARAIFVADVWGRLHG
ncbi:DUF935 domain-containing protein [Laribacter hongkongensis]|uniref:DUF935 domain-containing protein n=1 Tax=Laribacter hongkongensis TaxID=168471 RepID=UPI001EFD234B|nr:DUF935 domain-containing protein [Laribacter hongkongensis]MCG9031609.1 DUF935 domain-containing protein [Laribacter hongkongensis]MCG9093114.1 DUF935 domain-containing protein [Laribacter hongkongensis]